MGTAFVYTITVWIVISFSTSVIQGQEWTQWEGPPCDVTCGGSVTIQSRYVTCPNGTGRCDLQDRELPCNTQECTVGLTPWGSWIADRCLAICSQVVERRRTCIGECGDAALVDAELRPCTGGDCPVTTTVNGGWSEWGEWTGDSCSDGCGGPVNSIAFRTRSCTNPVPQSGGLLCPGDSNSTTVITCQQFGCTESEWSAWYAWIPTCAVTCGGSSVTGPGIRTRTCLTPPGGVSVTPCAGPAVETGAVNCGLGDCPVPDTWTEWSQWTVSCDVTCGSSASGVGIRTRSCDGGTLCPGVNSETNVQPCGLNDCPGTWAEWGPWTVNCFVTCGSSARGPGIRTRSCNGGTPCPGVNSEASVQQCGLNDCPVSLVDGQWSEWSAWQVGECSATCGSTAVRTMNRTRSCTNPAPANGGLDCDGEGLETSLIACNLGSCQGARVDGGWSQWSPWLYSECSATCGTALRQGNRARTCTDPAPSNGGLDCSGLDIESKDFDCYKTRCPVDGDWSVWGGWGSPRCQISCGETDQGSVSRARTCSNPSPMFGGQKCSGDVVETKQRTCILPRCPEAQTADWKTIVMGIVIAVGIILFITIIVFCFLICRRKKSKQKTTRPRTLDENPHPMTDPTMLSGSLKPGVTSGTASHSRFKRGEWNRAFGSGPAGKTVTFDSRSYRSGDF